MKIILEHISKRFQRYWIFKEVNHIFTVAEPVALLGSNGCGKSTLLRIIAGMQAPSLGKVHFYENEVAVPADKAFNYISYCAPGMELVEELTLREFFDFHFSFRRPIQGLSVNDIIELCGLNNVTDKTIGDYSSGMKQRVKLAQAIFSDTPALLLDEPCTNLDQQGVEQYRDWIERYSKGRLVIVASNDVREYFFCREHVEIEAYK